jgi:putative addiction module CopG family antidote
MAVLTVTLPPALDAFVRDQVAAGEYPDTDTLIHEAILRLMPRAEADAFRVERFNALVQVGLDEIERGAYAWSNELARHVIEVKTNGPVPGFGGVADGFDGELRRMHEQLAKACVFPRMLGALGYSRVLKGLCIEGNSK